MLYALCSMRYAFLTVLPDPPGIPITCRANEDARRKAAEAEPIEI
jgi:hypothetical protein